MRYILVRSLYAMSANSFTDICFFFRTFQIRFPI